MSTNNIWPTNNVGDDKSKTNIKHLSPYFSNSGDRPRTPVSKIDTIVFHWTGGSSAIGAINHLYTNVNSYHFIIEKDGTIIQTKPILEKANHSGRSYGPNGWSLNGTSIGISFVTVGGMIKKNLIEGIQLENGIKLVGDIQEALKNEGGGLKYFTTHHQISPARKEDPYSLEPEMISGKNIQWQLRKLLGVDITYWRAGMGPTWPKGLDGSCKCVDGLKLGEFGNHPNLSDSIKTTDGKKVAWCKKSSGDCFKRGQSQAEKYDYETMKVFINSKLKQTGNDDYDNRDTTDEPETTPKK